MVASPRTVARHGSECLGPHMKKSVRCVIVKLRLSETAEVSERKFASAKLQSRERKGILSACSFPGAFIIHKSKFIKKLIVIQASDQFELMLCLGRC